MSDSAEKMELEEDLVSGPDEEEKITEKISLKSEDVTQTRPYTEECRSTRTTLRKAARKTKTHVGNIKLGENSNATSRSPAPHALRYPLRKLSPLRRHRHKKRANPKLTTPPPTKRSQNPKQTIEGGEHKRKRGGGGGPHRSPINNRTTTGKNSHSWTLMQHKLCVPDRLSNLGPTDLKTHKIGTQKTHQTPKCHGRRRGERKCPIHLAPKKASAKPRIRKNDAKATTKNPTHSRHQATQKLIGKNGRRQQGHPLTGPAPRYTPTSHQPQSRKEKSPPVMRQPHPTGSQHSGKAPFFFFFFLH
ncbi:uncharacterized protein LOC130334011 [Hyla sarda]|uniref:uncharacterized protein LOC130334011 n=1 Tax=Hyla sarda TaxID=327740 RepID=UPI0024C4273D|nr:uncharacterized protein LOC130334011 [Hyla sarda]